jgi:imidazole glycerol-phosphate synthase subunit HisH
MKKNVVIVDYGVGNLLSVKRAAEECGLANVSVTNESSKIAAADRIILPGVGAFTVGMRGLSDAGLIGAILAASSRGVPLLGICLGMQLLASLSREFGTTAGLDIIGGEVELIENPDFSGVPFKVPFVGWAPLKLSKENTNIRSCLDQADGEAVYLVHSYQLVPYNSNHVLATYSYNGCEITAAVRNGNVTGVQFHPEKSGLLGLRIIRDFIA